MDLANEIPRPAVQEAQKEKARSHRAAKRASALPDDEFQKRRIILALVLGIVIGLACALTSWMLLRLRNRAAAVVVSINGAPVDTGMFFGRLQLASGPATLRELAGEQLQLQFAAKRGVIPTEAQIQARFDRDSAQPNFDELLAGRGETPEQYRESLRVELANAGVLTQGLQVIDAEVQQFYNENIDPRNPAAQFYRPDTAKIQVIVTKSEADAAAARKALDAGNPFEPVASHYSMDASKDNGGVMPIVQRGRTRSAQIPGLDDAIFSLKVGATVGPRKFAGAWWIIRCMDRLQAVTLPFDKVKDQCREGALLAKGIKINGKAVAKDFDAFEKQAHVVAFWPQYSDAVNFKK